MHGDEEELDEFSTFYGGSEMQESPECAECSCKNPFCIFFLNHVIQNRFKYSRKADSFEHKHVNICGFTFCLYGDVYVRHLCKKNVGIGDIRNLKMQKKMIIYCEDMSRFAQVFCEEENISVLYKSMIPINFNNEFIPRIYKLKKKEIQILINTYGPLKNFPRIKSSDILLRLLGARKKDVITIYRKNMDCADYVYYRVVI